MAACLGIVACAGPQRVLDARGPAAEQIASLWWLFLAAATFTTVAISGLLLYAIRLARRRDRGLPAREIAGDRLVWIGGAVVPALMLFTVLVASNRLSTELEPSLPPGAEPLTIELTGHQFWWEVRYPQHDVVTANEFHIPYGTPVRLRIRASDVIHSLWVPQLTGKIDMIPGRTHTWWLHADSAGSFRGQCAEYCGMSHALMAFHVTAVSPDRFDAWIARRTREPAIGEPSPDQGRAVFVRAGCGHCHATADAPLPPELGSPGPDLSDFGTRTTIAAGTMENSPGNLAAWIADPRGIKPGVEMPPTRLTPAAMEALLTYLYGMTGATPTP